MRYTDQSSLAKVKTIIACSIIALLMIYTRLIYLQIFHYQSLALQGKKNFTRISSIEPLRGNIVDCKQKLLATNRPVIHLNWIGTGNAKLDTTQLKIIEKIQQVLEKHNHKLLIELGQIKRAEKLGIHLQLARDVSIQALSEISEQCADSPNIEISKSFQRFYPHQNLACHILGYLGDNFSHHTSDKETTGKMGLELIFDTLLKGKQGSMNKIINSFGKNLAISTIIQSQSGKNLTLTLDIDLQKIAEQLMPADLAGTFILYNPKDGQLKALVSKPGFDPAMFLKPISHQDWANMQKNKPFINRAFNALYPPASIFKLVTFSAAIEKNIIQPNSQFYCKGYHTFKGRKYYCNKRNGHGLLDIKDNLTHSCNIGCFHVAEKISIDTLADYAYRFGLGAKTNSMFPESPGLIPSNEWKRRVKKEAWWTGETLSAAIGQSFLLVTPIQITCMIGAIFTGYVTKPRILEDDPIQSRPLTIEQSTREFLQESMKAAIATGTARNMNRLKHITMYAKTGTAQTKSRSGETKEVQNDCHAWSVIYFTYKDQDPLVMTIFIEHAGGSAVATTVAKKFLAQYMKIMG